MLEQGKLDSELLKKIVFDKITYKRDEIITSPGIGEDCAEIDFGENICTVSTDPITASVNDIGRLSIHISCNDIASNGVQPVGIMLSVLLPLGTTEEDIENIMGQAAKAAESMEVQIIGGHTEITNAVNTPVITSTAIGIDRKNKKKTEVKEGDIILMTKSAGLEGTGIIASDDKSGNIANILTEEEISHAKGMLDKVSVVTEGVTAGKIGYSQMHDVTEGGILGAVWELCSVGGKGCEVKKESIPVDPVTRKVCEAKGIDVYRLISSGSMVIIARPGDANNLIKEIKDITIIGEIKPKEYGILMDGEEIEPPGSDEIYKVV